MPLHTPNFKRQALLAVLFLLVFSCYCVAKTSMDVKIGYENVETLGRWVPVRVTLADAAMRNVQLRVEVPGGDMGTMSIAQTVPIGPTPQTFVLYAPQNTNSGRIRVLCADPKEGRLLARYPEDGEASPFDLGSSSNLVLVSGSTSVLRGFRDGSGRQTLTAASIDEQELPTTPIGYDSASCVLLMSPQLARLTLDQQNALITWIKLGGTLIYWPGTEPIPTDSPLIQSLPCTVGDIGTYTMPARTLESEGLSGRFAELSYRSLKPRGLAQTFGYFKSDSGLQAVIGRLGAGRVMVLPSDPSLLQFNSGPQAFWQDKFSRLLHEDLDAGTMSYSDPASTAAKDGLDLIGEIPGTGSLGFGYIALTLALLALVVGPIDYFVLRRLGRPAWTWATTTGWIVLITSGALFLGHLMRSGDLHFHSLQIIEQVDDQVLMREDIALIYAPQSRMHTLSGPQTIWWRPVGESMSYARDSGATPLDFHETQVGTLPESMWIDVWSYRFLRGVRFDPQPPIIKATIRQRDAMPNHVNITLQNLTDRLIYRVRVVLPTGVMVKARLNLKPGQTIELTDPETIRAADANKRTGTETEGNLSDDMVQGSYSISADDQVLKIHPRLPEPLRLGQEDSGISRDIAIVTGEIFNPSTDLSLDPPGAKEQHRAFFRAIVPTEGFEP